MGRQEQIIAIARGNAQVGLDQNAVEDYFDNMRETIGGMFPDCTREEAILAEDTFNEIVTRHAAIHRRLT